VAILTLLRAAAPRVEVRIMKGIKYSIVIAGALVLGCGGSQGVSGFPDPPVPSVSLPTGPGIAGGTAMRLLRAGDTWEYEVKGTMLREEYDQSSSQISKNSGPVTGNMVRTVSAVNLVGAPVLKVTEALTYKLNGGLITVEVLEWYVTQNAATGAISMVGRRQNKTDFDPATGQTAQPWLPGTFAAGANVGGSAKFDNTPDYLAALYDTSTAFSVTGAGSVAATSAPAFSTWRSVFVDSMQGEWGIIERARVGDSLTTGFIFNTREDISSEDEWSPVIGAPVKRKYGSSRVDAVIQSDVVYTPPTFDATTGVQTAPDKVTYKYHTIKRTLDVEMILKNRSLL
jgi:hypothetical protein